MRHNYTNHERESILCGTTIEKMRSEGVDIGEHMQYMITDRCDECDMEIMVSSHHFTDDGLSRDQVWALCEQHYDEATSSRPLSSVSVDAIRRILKVADRDVDRVARSMVSAGKDRFLRIEIDSKEDYSSEIVEVVSRIREVIVDIWGRSPKSDIPIYQAYLKHVVDLNVQSILECPPDHVLMVWHMQITAFKAMLDKGLGIQHDELDV